LFRGWFYFCFFFVLFCCDRRFIFHI
jgi:hypothetical protein